MTASTDRIKSLTKNQELVHAALCGAGMPMGAYALLDILRGDGFRAPLQVYRALDKLQALGLVHRVESLNAFVACAHADQKPHSATAFAICENCGSVTEFSDDAATRTLHRWASGKNFHILSTAIELKGLCRDCAH